MAIVHVAEQLPLVQGAKAFSVGLMAVAHQVICTQLKGDLFPREKLL